jgi:hypothetical protein
MKKYITKIYSIILLTFVALPVSVLAQANPRVNLGQSAPDIIKQNNINVFIGQIIQGVLGFLGIIFVILIIYAGFVLMTAGGDATKVTKAKGIISRAILGLVVVMLSYAISFYVISQLTNIQ